MVTIGGQSELEKAMRRHPGSSPDALIEDLAERLSLEGEVEPPVDMHLLASLQSITEVRQVLSRHSGCLINDNGRLRVELCATDNPERQQFTLGHEISHTLLPGFTMSRNFRCNPGVTRPEPGGLLNVEWLADVGASELLMPRRFIEDDFAASPFGWDSIEDIASRYRASLAATGRRYVRLAAPPVFFASLEMATSRDNPVPRLRVTSASWSPVLDVFIPKHKSVPLGHPITRAVHGEDVDATVDMSDLRLPGSFRVVARPYPYTNYEGETVMRILALGTQPTPASTHRLARRTPAR